MNILYKFVILLNLKDSKTENKMEKTFTLVLVRHGEAVHNVAPTTLSESDFFKETEQSLKIMDCNLTKKGHLQAGFVADRLQDYKFDLAITSDMKRTTKTAEAIMKKNDSVEKLKNWQVVRERCKGDFQGNKELSSALNTLENAATDRDYMTWRPPNGESLVDFRMRVRQFLHEIQNEAKKIPVECPAILVVSHGLFMIELYRIISNSEYGNTLPKIIPDYPNTAIAQYSFTCQNNENNSTCFSKVECSILSCVNHLLNHDDDPFIRCRGGCHG